MRLRFCLILLALLLAIPSTELWAQAEDTDQTTFPMGDLAQQALLAHTLLSGEGSVFTGALGATVIDDDVYLGLRLQPELSFKKLGVGLDIPLLFNASSGSLRRDEFEDGAGYARMIRYLRWGRKKQDPFYIKVGDISGTTLGFGFVMYQYSNVGSFEKRPIGTEFDVNYERKVGLEGMYSDFSDGGVWGVRPYVRPLRLADVNIPLLRNLEIGVVYATDASDLATPGGAEMTVWGADMGLPISLSSMVTVVPYAAYAQFKDPGSEAFAADSLAFTPGAGAAIGVNFDFNFVANIFSLHAKVERRFYENHFTGSYFDANYEVNKLSFAQGGTPPLSKLEGSDGSNGIFGGLYGHVINKILIGGSLLIPDAVATDSLGQVTNGAFLRIEASAPDLIPKVVAQAVYNRNFIENLGDAIKLDEKSALYFRLGYKIKPYLLVGTDYRWTFARVEEDNVDRVKATSYVFPFVALQFDFNLNKGTTP